MFRFETPGLMTRPPLALLFFIGLWFMGLCLAGPVRARQVEAAVEPPAEATASAQFYVLSFTDAPIAEVAEAVVGGALAEGLAIDPAIDGTMSFTAEGSFTREGLLEEFGTAALDQEVALVRSRAGDLALVPRPNLAAELARGGTLVSLVLPASAAPVEAGTVAVAPIVYGQDRWWDGALGGMLIFLTGAASGAAALYAGHRILARRRVKATTPVLMIAHAPLVSAGSAQDDPELTIPRFETRRRDG